MDYFIIGDIHGCYFTFSKMLEHWNSETEILVSVGDLIDRGNYNARVVNHCMQLTQTHPNTVFLKGNHEVELIKHFRIGYNKLWVDYCGRETLEDFEANRVDIPDLLTWMEAMPLKYEIDALLVSHAGVSETSNPFDVENPEGVIWNRSPLKDLNKLQVHGHTPLKSNQPRYSAASQSWNIDTGAVYGYGLTGLKLSAGGTLSDTIFIPTDEMDIK